jgi:hypothetical protein
MDQRGNWGKGKEKSALWHNRGESVWPPLAGFDSNRGRSDGDHVGGDRRSNDVDLSGTGTVGLVAPTVGFGGAAAGPSHPGLLASGERV